MHGAIWAGPGGGVVVSVCCAVCCAVEEICSFLVGTHGNKVVSFSLSKKQKLTKVISTISASGE